MSRWERRATALGGAVPAPAKPSTTPGSDLPAATGLVWFRPDEDPGPLVLSGETSAAFEEVARELRHVPRFLAAGVDPPNRLLFSGPTGTGKTLAARCLGRRLRLPVAIVDVSAIVGSLLGETMGNIANAFRAAAAVRSVLFLDEVDAICQRRGRALDGAGSEMERATTTLLQQFDWLDPAHVVVAATNFPDQLDSALRRRITTELPFGLPDLEARRTMLAAWLAKAPLLPSQLDALANETEGMSGASLRARAMAKARRMIMLAPPPPDEKKGGELELTPEQRKQIAEGAQSLLGMLERMEGAPA